MVGLKLKRDIVDLSTEKYNIFMNDIKRSPKI